MGLNRLWRLAGGAAGLLLVAEILFHFASYARGPVTFDLGPWTGRYLEGFRANEEQGQLSFRWSHPKAAVNLPLKGRSGSATLIIRYARFIDEPVRTRIFISGTPVASFTADPGPFRTKRFPVTLREGPLRLDMVTESCGVDDLCLAVDWIRLEGGKWSLAGARIEYRLMLLGIFILCLLSGFELFGAFCTGLAMAFSGAFWFALDPFGYVHVISSLAFTALIFAAACAAFVPKRKGSRWIIIICLGGYLLKGAGLFYPSYLHPEVRSQRQYLLAFSESPGAIPLRGQVAQIKANSAYPRSVAEKDYALPYSPIFYVPFTWLLQKPHPVDDAMKHVALTAAAAEVLIVFWLAGLVFGPSSGVAAALLSVFLPPLFHGLLLAMWPAVTGHFFESLAIAALVLITTHSRRVWAVAIFAAATLSSFLLYFSNILNLCVLGTLSSLLDRQLAIRKMAVLAGAAAVPVVIFCGYFVEPLVVEILPAIWHSGTGSSMEDYQAALARIIEFYGYGFIAFSLSGFVVAFRSVDRRIFAILAAYGLTFAFLTLLRAANSNLLSDVRELLFVGPLIAVSTGASIEALAARGRKGMLTAALVAVGLLAYGAAKYVDYFNTFTSLAGLG